MAFVGVVLHSGRIARIERLARLFIFRATSSRLTDLVPSGCPLLLSQTRVPGFGNVEQYRLDECSDGSSYGARKQAVLHVG
jgi:hypothetical protein